MNSCSQTILLMKKNLFIITLLVAYHASNAQLQVGVLNSPDKRIAFRANIKNNKLFYSIRFDKRPILATSAMGMQIDGGAMIGGADITLAKQKTINKSFPSRGLHSRVSSTYTLGEFEISGSAPFKVEVCVFNHGVAFRYVIINSKPSIIEKEFTEFTFPAGSMIWSQANIKNYEGKYEKKLVDTILPGMLIGPPAVFELPGTGYASVTEASLVDFAGMSLIAGGNRKFVVNLFGSTEKKSLVESPWRVIMIGKDLNTLVNNDIIACLSPMPDKKIFPKGFNTEWIKPGRSVWSWLADRRQITLENMKYFTDLAALLGYEYNLIDEGWGAWKDTAHHKDHWAMMKDLVDYSANKSVKIWVWKAYPDRKGIPGIKDAQTRTLFFQKCRELGIAGVKIDFMDSEAQEIIQFYQLALREAAENKLMINFHGANKPTGESVTWPNEMTREAVRGLENRPPWAYNNTVLPFTRYLAGHGDFTPIHFGNRMGEISWAHHVASMIIFTSPFQCLGADPRSVLDNPCREIIKSIPADWDETIVLPGSAIGEMALYARRKKDTWFIAGMSSKKVPSTVEVNFNFLKVGSYAFSYVRDDQAEQNNGILQQKLLTAADKFSILMNSNGGFAGRLDKK